MTEFKKFALDWKKRLFRESHAENFQGSQDYWEHRYRKGGNSGAGSYGELANFKAEVLNDFCARHAITSVIEHGCGDGHQLSLAQYPSYLGIDVSMEALGKCRARFHDDASKRFLAADMYDGQRAELALSLDVIFHLVEDPVFDAYMRRLFDSATRYVIIYSSNDESLNNSGTAPHVRHRHFTSWITSHAPEWREAAHVPNRFPFDPARPDQTSFCEFFIYGR